ncbi:MAG TPA: alpha/beta fold hydrolase [Candidatus Methylomirabilis sp.]|nr:alpha/beta fold hydrolase [Candidatus Methylomirabilis sp.]
MEQAVSIGVSSGVGLEARLQQPEDAQGGLVVCHPHPLYGGDMDNPVVVRVAEVGSESGLSTLRFNFRGVGRSTGHHAQGEGEQDDLKAAIHMLLTRLPAGRPLGVAGYSFGAWIAARVAGSGVSLAALCLVAPPLAMLDFGTLEGADMDVLVVSGTRDTYCPLPRLAALSERLPHARVETVEGADHFFFGKLFPLGETVRRWARRWAHR